MTAAAENSTGTPDAGGAPDGAARASADAAGTLAGAARPSWHDEACRRALALGADAAAVLEPAQVVTAEWVRAKCFWGGCTVGRCLTCPPHSPSPAQTRALLDGYAAVLALRFDARPERGDEYLTVSRRTMEVAPKLERELFLDGHYKAFALAGGRPCRREAACGTPESCDCRAQVRPGPAGCGIDVFATSANAGWPLAVIRGPGEPYHRLALVLAG
jgi:predicted metal-binding protein